MKNPVAIFSSIAAVAAVALGATIYTNKTPEAPASVSAPAEASKPPEPATQSEAPAAEAPAAASSEAPAAPAAEAPAAATAATPVPEAPAQQQAAADPSPAIEQPASAENQPSEVAMVPVAPAGSQATAEPASGEQQDVAVAPSLPSFDTVRVETTGDAVIAGRAEPDSDVTVKWNGNVVGTTKANADGSFVLVPAKALKTGIGAMTIEMSKSGKITVSEGSVFVVVKKDAPATVAKVDPVAPTQVVQAGTPVETPKDLQLTAVDYDTAGNIVFSGKAAPGTTVRFYVDNAPTGEGMADVTGGWRFSGTSSVTPGTHMLRADAVDAAGAVLSRIEVPFLREDVATVAAAQVAVATPAEQPAVSRSVAAEEPVVQATEQPSAPAVEPAAQPVAETQVAATPEQPAAVVVDEGPRKLVIQPGNNLWKLSREVYGKGRMYTIIYEANRELVKNPNRIYPGQILTAPKQP